MKPEMGGAGPVQGGNSCLVARYILRFELVFITDVGVDAVPAIEFCLQMVIITRGRGVADKFFKVWEAVGVKVSGKFPFGERKDLDSGIEPMLIPLTRSVLSSITAPRIL